MSELKAFVGHSFTDEDEIVVRAILDYLKQIQEMGIGFSWDHAKKAAPKELTQKVLALIDNKNLFIGICTKKERVIVPKKLSTKFFARGTLCAKDDDFSWKTSDWIIQEIGLAIGRKMDIILLIEEGLREPGGLQGNIEYIEFTRQNPEKSFVKILEMITTLLAKAKPINEAVAEMPQAGEEDEPKEEDDEWLKPKPEWDRSDYDVALMHMVAIADKGGEEKIDKTYLQTDEGKTPEYLDSWMAMKEYYHILFAKDGSLERLEILAKEKSDNSDVQKYLARGYKQFDEELKAAESFLHAAEKETDQKRKLSRLGEAACAYAKAKKKYELNKLIEQIKKQAYLVDGGEIVLLEISRDVAKIQEDKIMHLASTERLLDLRPDDSKSRFNLAYGHSEEAREDLALYHYLKIPYNNRDSSDWNNIGVANERLGLNGKAVEAYRKAEEKENTLAMDNIAKKYLATGFTQEAEQQCNKAKQKENYHKNIDDTLFKLKNKREEEDKKQKEILEKTKPLHEFYIEYGRAASKVNAPDFTGIWTTSQCKLKLDLKDRKFRAYGTYDVPQFGLRRALGAGVGGVDTKKYEVLYEGEASGYAIKGTLRISEVEKDAKASTLLTQNEDTKDVLMFISDDLESISVFQESATSDHTKFHKIKKEPPTN